MILRFIFSDLKSNPLFFLFYVFNFAIGLAGFVALDSFKIGIQDSLRENSKEYLSADISLSARRMLSDKEVAIARETLPKGFTESRLIEMFTMVSTAQGSRLVQLKIVDEAYPFYGKMHLQNAGQITGARAKEINQEPKAWVYPELLNQLNLKVGDRLKIGQLHFTLSDVILDDSTQTFRLASLAPKIYIGMQTLSDLGLIQTGSTLTEARLYKVPTQADLTEMKSTLLNKFEDPALQVSLPADAQEDSGRVIGYLSDYLGLVSLVGFCLALIGAIFLFRSFLNSRVKSLAILNVMGLTFPRALGIFVGELLIAGLVSASLAIMLSLMIVPIIQHFLSQFTMMQIQSILHFKSLVVAFLVSVLGVLLSSLPYLVALKRIQTAQLLQESSQLELPLRLKDFTYFIPLLMFFYFLSLFQANSIKVGSLFFFGLLASFVILFLFAQGILQLIGILSKRVQLLELRQAALFISRKKNHSLPVILALAMSALLFNLIPQLKVGLLEEFSVQKGTKIPGLFLFDIQDEQMSGLEKEVEAMGLSLQQNSPLVRARILTVNNQIFEKKVEANKVFKTREEEAEARFRNRGFNLSYRKQLTAAEKVVEGTFNQQEWNPGSGVLPEVSIEERYALRLGLKLGDILKFDIQGVEVEGRVTSLRSVKWNSFQPNFFVLFQSGVLNEAPKTWLASIPQTDQQKKLAVQNRLAGLFPNVSVVDIERTTTRILEMVTKMSWALQLMSFLSLVAGVFVIYSISREQNEKRRWDLNLNKILGVRKGIILRQGLFEALLVSLTAALSGVFMSLLLAYSLSIFLFEGIFIPDLYWPILSILIITGLGVLISLLTGLKIVRENPIAILREG